MYEESLRIRRKVLGNEHTDVAQSLNNLAQLLKAQVRLAGFCCSALLPFTKSLHRGNWTRQRLQCERHSPSLRKY